MQQKKINIVIDLGGNKLHGKNKNCACLLYIHQKQNRFKEYVTSLSVTLSQLLKMMQLLVFFIVVIKYIVNVFKNICFTHQLIINYFITYGVCINVKFFHWGLHLIYMKILIYKACCFFAQVELWNLNNVSNI